MDDNQITDTLIQLNSNQRQQLKVKYQELYKRDLVKDLKCGSMGSFKWALLALLQPPEIFAGYDINKAVKGLTTDHSAMCEILLTKSTDEMHALVNSYHDVFEGDLDLVIVENSSGDFRALLMLMLGAHREAGDQVDLARAKEDANKLLHAGELRWGTDEKVFNKILTSLSLPQLRATFDCYKTESGKNIEDSIKSETSGNLCQAYLDIVSYTKNSNQYFADKLKNSCRGLLTDVTSLTRIIVGRSEIDLKNIAVAFEKSYSRPLRDVIMENTRWSIRRLLTAILSRVEREK